MRNTLKAEDVLNYLKGCGSCGRTVSDLVQYFFGDDYTDHGPLVRSRLKELARQGQVEKAYLPRYWRATGVSE
jgi:hypothetical protein